MEPIIMPEKNKENQKENAHFLKKEEGRIGSLANRPSIVWISRVDLGFLFQ